MIRRLSRLLGPDAARLRAFLRWSVAANALRGLAFVLVVPVVARLLTGDVRAAGPWLATLAICAIAATGAGYLASVRGFDTAIALLRTIRERIGDHVVTLPVGWFVPDRTGQLRVTLSQGVMDLTSLPAHRLEPLIQAVVTPAVLTIGIAIVDLRLAGVLVVCLPLLGAALWWASRLGRRADARVAATAAEAAERMVEFSHAQPLLRIDREGLWRRRFDRSLVELRRAQRRQLLLVLPPVFVNGFVARLAFLALLGAIAALATDAGSLDEVVTLVALLAIVNRVIEPIGDLAGHSAALRMSNANLREAEAIVDARPLPQPDHPRATPTSYDVALDQVTFGYQPDEPVLHDVSLTVPQGSMTALVGASGSGKTTITKLAARFWDPNEGSVRIGGADLRDLRDEQVARLVAPVFQEAYLLPGTLRDNLLLARPDADAAELDEVAELARVAEIVARLPDGWDTVVGDGGATLSGGERQRVTIARALLKQAPVVLLDEATGALDAENQAAIAAGLATLRGRCTLLVVAHQLSTITSADQIVVLEAGRVVEVGSHETLLAAEGHYAASWAALSGAEGWRSATPGASGDG